MGTQSKYIKESPQSGPVTIKGTLSETQCWCTITPSNTSLTKDTKYETWRIPMFQSMLRDFTNQTINDFEKGWVKDEWRQLSLLLRQWMCGLWYRRWPVVVGLDWHVTVFTMSYQPASAPRKKGHYITRQTAATTITSHLINNKCAKRCMTGSYWPAPAPQKSVIT